MGDSVSPSNEGFYTVKALRRALKNFPDDAIVCVADCHLVTHEIDGQKVALTRARKLVHLRAGEFNHKRPIMNFAIIEGCEDAVCLFPDKSREVEECKSIESKPATGVNSTGSSSSARGSTPSEAPTAPAKRTLSIRSSSRSRGTFHGFME